MSAGRLEDRRESRWRREALSRLEPPESLDKRRMLLYKLFSYRTPAKGFRAFRRHLLMTRSCDRWWGRGTVVYAAQPAGPRGGSCL